ncbi:hypothetical protein [Pelotomaculum propionicicum]|uniref:Uncharacterized protein n=1 Tax=Pelotomaculum propionicicum TaxID=258475 RepID=A0A4Y7RXC2_9FIRM|nr:hypothetical protein [Pelotomaculum propionicicum]TEB13410.1 hypothetical protein Pmgp_00304 [Pelotomaculum propionicicum]
MSITAITLERDRKYTAFCDTLAFKEGKCEMDARDKCPQKKDICCIICAQLEECDQQCNLINPDE